MELTKEEKLIVVNILSQVSIPVKESPIVLRIIEKLKIEDSIVSKET